MQFKNKKQLVLPIIFVSLAIGFLFHQKINIGPLSLSSLSSANQLISTYNNEQKLRTMSITELSSLTTKINSEISSISIASRPLRESLNTLRSQQSALQRNASSARQTESLASSQVSKQMLSVLSIERQITKITTQYNKQLQLCRKLTGRSKKTCLKRADNIQRTLTKPKANLVAAKTLLTTYDKNLVNAKNVTKTANEAVTLKTNEIKVISQNISVYESQISQLGQLLTLIEELGRTEGCRDYGATNYNANATVDDGSCLYPPNSGCTSPGAVNYMPSATTDDGSCINRYGCMDSSALNFDYMAVVDDASCLYSDYDNFCTLNPDSPECKCEPPDPDKCEFATEQEAMKALEEGRCGTLLQSTVSDKVLNLAQRSTLTSSSVNSACYDQTELNKIIDKCIADAGEYRPGNICHHQAETTRVCLQKWITTNGCALKSEFAIVKAIWSCDENKDCPKFVIKGHAMATLEETAGPKNFKLNGFLMDPYVRLNAFGNWERKYISACDPKGIGVKVNNQELKSVMKSNFQDSNKLGCEFKQVTLCATTNKSEAIRRLGPSWFPNWIN